MGLFNLFQKKQVDDNILKPVQFSNNLWNKEWHSIEFKVAGVTFENRQAILRKLDNGNLKSIYFRKSTFESEPCVEVYANDRMVGFVPNNRLNEFLKWCEKPYAIKYKKVTKAEGTYGLTINVVFQNIIPLHERNMVSSEVYLIVGEKYECRKNKKVMRKTIITKMRENDKVIIERYTFEGEAAYMVIDPKTHLDIGVLPAYVAEDISSKYKKAVFDAHLTERHADSFKVQVDIYV